jgi:NADH dehydrogenase FAD-containing subunit
VAVCGAGAAGVELSFAFKKRWSELFKTEIEVTLISGEDEVFKFDCEAVRKQVLRKLKEKNINVVVNGTVAEV